MVLIAHAVALVLALALTLMQHCNSSAPLHLFLFRQGNNREQNVTLNIKDFPCIWARRDMLCRVILATILTLPYLMDSDPPARGMRHDA